MIHRSCIGGFVGVLACALVTPTSAQVTQRSTPFVLPSDADIRAMIAQRVETIAGKEDGVGIVVGVIGPQGRRIISYGHFNQGDPRLLNGETVFEIASVTKVFTALVLADMVQKGEIALADPVAKYLPANVSIPERNGRSITLLDLVTHTSGLPFMPDKLPSFSDSGLANESSTQLYRFLAGYRLQRDIGAEWDYSNIGYWLLGEALAHRAGMDFESLLSARILTPLKLNSTAITHTPEIKANLAVGHDAVLQASPYFASLPVYSLMPAAGGLVSTTNNLLTFLSAVMGYGRSPLAPAMAAMLGTRRPKSKPGDEQALGWIVTREGDDELIFHDGGSLGFSSSLAWDPKKRIGVVVLSNQMAGVNDIACHLLRPDFPLEKPVAAKLSEIALDSITLGAYAGSYEVPGEGTFTLALERHFLTFDAPAEWGLPKLRLHSESRTDFFATEIPLRVTFQTDGGKDVTGMLIYPPRGQKALLAKKRN